MIDTSTNQRKYYLDFLRTFSCILIVFVHVSANGYDRVSARSFSWQVMNFYDCLGIVGVPLFVMISGALLLDEKYTLSMKKLFGKILHLGFLYFLWLGIYNLFTYFDGNTVFTFETFKDQVLLQSLLGKGIYHLWFLPMLIALYLVVPILRQIVLSKKTCEYFLFLYFIITLLLPTCFKYDFPYRTILMSIYEKTPFMVITGYSGYFILGYYLDKHVTLPAKSCSKKQTISLLAIAILPLLLAIALCGIDGYLRNEASTIMNDPLTFTMFLTCIGVFLLFKNASPSSDHLSKSRWLLPLSRLSLGIYLLHPLMIAQLEKAGITSLFLTPLLSIPILVCVIVIACLIISFLLSKIPFIGKYVI